MKGINRETPLQVTISAQTIGLLVLIILGIATLYYLTSVVITVFLAIVLAALVEPVVTKLHQYRVPKALTVLGVYALLLAATVGFCALVIPPLVTEVQLLGVQYAPLIERLSENYPIVQELTSGDFFRQDLNLIVQQLQQWKITELFSGGAASILSVLSGLFGNVLAFFGVLVLALYFIVDPPKFSQKETRQLLPAHWDALMHEIAPKVQHQVGAWLRGQLLIMFVVFALAYLGLTALGVPFALALAIIAGLLEVIPFLGPNLAAIPAIIIAASVSWPIALGTAIVYFIIQQLENHLLSPVIYRKVAGVNPVISIVAILVGLELGYLVGGNILTSVLGGALALPVTVTLGVFVKEWLAWRAKYKESL